MISITNIEWALDMIAADTFVIAACAIARVALAYYEIFANGRDKS